MKTLHVSAGGRGERIADYIASIAPLRPKHLLPIPTPGRTILGDIVLRGHRSFEEVAVWASKETYPSISLEIERLTTTNVLVDAKMSGPLGPMLRSLLETKARTYGCAGDFYCDFSWDEFERFHAESGKPVSILVARSVPAPKGARFHLSNGVVTTWERVNRTSKKDLINMGCYIIDATPEVLEEVARMKVHKEDQFFDTFIPKNMVSGFNPGIMGFNVNVSEVYESLLHSLA